MPSNARTQAMVQPSEDLSVAWRFARLMSIVSSIALADAPQEELDSIDDGS